MNKTFTKALSAGVVVAALFAASQAQAACSDLGANAAAINTSLTSALKTAVPASGTPNGGFGLPMWLTFVDETGAVCAVVTSGDTGALASRKEWLGSRVISAQKANTANAFSLNGVSISSGALYAAVQPGGSLFGLQESNPVDASVAYKGLPASYGKANDPLVGKRIGGVNVFGGGIAVYKNGVKIGAFGVSGDTSCTDHAVVWKVRNALALEPTGLSANFEKLTITSVYADLGDHPTCANDTSIKLDANFGFVDPN